MQTSGCAALPLAQELEKAVVELAPSLSVRDAAAICWSLSGIAAGRGVAFDAAFGAVADASSNFASGEGRALANLASAVVDMYGDDSGGLADNGLDVRRILDAVAALAVPLAEGAALEPRALAALAAAFAACRAAAPAPRLMAALAAAARDAAADFQAKDLVAAADAARARCHRRPSSPRPCARSAPTRRAAPRRSRRGSAPTCAARSPPSARRTRPSSPSGRAARPLLPPPPTPLMARPTRRGSRSSPSCRTVATVPR